MGNFVPLAMMNPKKILIIDDDPDDQEFLLEAIHELYPDAHNVIKSDGAAALEYIEHNPPPPTLIFLDLNMPLVDGYEFLSKFKNRPRNNSSRIIIYTTSSHPNDMARTRELGADDFMTKVADLGVLKKRIRQVVEKVV